MLGGLQLLEQRQDNRRKGAVDAPCVIVIHAHLNFAFVSRVKPLFDGAQPFELFARNGVDLVVVVEAVTTFVNTIPFPQKFLGPAVWREPMMIWADIDFHAFAFFATV